MNISELVQSSIFATVLTLLVTVATCVITQLYGYKKMKIERFREIYECLEKFSEKRAEIVEKCNQMSYSLEASMPEQWNKKAEKKRAEYYMHLYQRMNEMLAEYSGFLEHFLSFSHFLYKNKPVLPVVKAECWYFLDIYERIAHIESGLQEACGIEYTQIAAFVQFIRLTGKRKDRKKLKEYFRRNHINIL